LDGEESAGGGAGSDAGSGGAGKAAGEKRERPEEGSDGGGGSGGEGAGGGGGGGGEPAVEERDQFGRLRSAVVSALAGQLAASSAPKVGEKHVVCVP
jgi:hypothetical protein